MLLPIAIVFLENNLIVFHKNYFMIKARFSINNPEIIPASP